jgi:hypothetical protein
VNKKEDSRHFRRRNAFDVHAFKIIAAFLFFSGGFLDAQIISLSGGLDATFYDKNASTIGGAAPLGIAVNALFEGFFGSVFHYNASLESDPVTDYSVNLGIGFDMGAVDFGLGLLLNSPTWDFSVIDRGIFVNFGLKFPDFMFFSATYVSSLNSGSEVQGDRTLNTFDLELGFWLRNILASANVERKVLYIIETMYIRKSFSRTKAFLRFNMYGKNVPIIIVLDAGIMLATAEIADYTDYDDGVGEIIRIEDPNFSAPFGGLRLNFSFGKNFVWFLGTEIPIPLAGSLSGFLFRAETGIVITINPK